MAGESRTRSWSARDSFSGAFEGEMRCVLVTPEVDINSSLALGREAAPLDMPSHAEMAIMHRVVSRAALLAVCL